MRFKLTLALVVSALVLSGCAGNQELTKPKVAKTYNSISGRVGVDGPILAVKIDDTRLARPQIGVDDEGQQTGGKYAKNRYGKTRYKSAD